VSGELNEPAEQGNEPDEGRPGWSFAALLALLGIPQPKEMTSCDLRVRTSRIRFAAQ
jgi:hypothetical protein